MKHLLIEPFKWVFYYFFQTDQFKRKVDELKVTSRYRGFLFRLGLPTFLISYILVLAVLAALVTPVALQHSIKLNLSILLDLSGKAAVGAVLGIGVGIAWEVAAEIPISIAGGIWLGFWLGMCMMFFSWGVGLSIFVSTIGGIALGIRDLGKYKRGALEDFVRYLNELNTKIAEDYEAVKQRGSKAKGVKSLVDDSAIMVGSRVFAFAGGIGTRIDEEHVRRIGRGILICMVIGFLGGIVGGKLDANIGGDIFLGMTFGIAVGIVGGIALVLYDDTVSTITIGLGGGIVVGASITLGTLKWANAFTFVIPIVPAITAGGAWLLGMILGAKAAGKFTVSNKFIFVLSMLASLMIGCAVGILAGYGAIFVFIICYFLSSYRLPLYLISILSLRKVYRASIKNPSSVFDNLQGSALHWSEQVPFPLPYLQTIMLTSAHQNTEQTVNEIQFILKEKSWQMRVALVGELEIVIQALEELKTLGDIAELTPFLIKFMQDELDLLPSTWRPRFSYLYEASRDASRYRNSLSWQTRHDALESMIENLKSINFKKFSSSSALERQHITRMRSLNNLWLDRARAKLEELSQEFHSIDEIDNPYVVGPVLAQETSPFVGRRNIAQQLEQDLRRGSHRPTFFLSGERRMGKSSLLKQLPRLLDDHSFLPIFFDLQAPRIRSSAAAFFDTVSEEIQRVLATKGQQVEKLERSYLHEVSLRNEAEVYFFFDEWLKKIEPILVHEGLVLLLSFDEFDALLEEPENEEESRHIDLSWLLSWFRSVIQDRPQLAFLFSGRRTIDEIGNEAGINWASYFVNVQTLKVSFLKENEARQLITQPIPISYYDYPIEQIFGNGVVDEIVCMTGCHPFLVQAVCSELVKYLNAINRDRAEIKDVKIAAEQVLEKFQATYFMDLWERTDDSQRVCLITIKSLGEGDLLKILQKSSLDEKTTRRTLQTLLKRDLIVLKDGNYRIASPIFAEWVEQNS